MDFKYILTRAREAGFKMTVKKILQHLRPYFYFPVYALPYKTKVTTSQLKYVNEFGDLLRQVFCSINKDNSQRVIRVQKRLKHAMSNETTVLGYGKVSRPLSGDEWYTDQVHNYTWPYKFFSRIDYISLGIRADIKIPWELSRLQSLVWVAEAYVISNNKDKKSLLDFFVSTVNRWSEANPVGFGVNWICGMEVAIRAVNLSIATAIFYRDIEKEIATSLVGLLRDHQTFLRRFPEISDHPGNHYLADLMGEVFLSSVLDGLNTKVTQSSLKRFSDEAQKQFEHDGCHIEKSTIYHRLATEMVSIPYAISLRSKSNESMILQEIMERACRFMSQLCDDEGRLPVFGDQDSGFIIWFRESPQLVDGRLINKKTAEPTDLYDFLCAFSGDTYFVKKHFTSFGKLSGFATLASKRFKVVMKTGPQGLFGRAPHDHDDALSICVTCIGKLPLFIDYGSHSYTLEPNLRKQAILSSSHNAPFLAGIERTRVVSGSINQTIKGAKTAILEKFSDKEMIGSLSLDFNKIRFKRHITIGNCLSIIDEWRMNLSKELIIRWHVHPQWIISIQDQSIILASNFTFEMVCEKLRLTVSIRGADGRISCRKGTYSPDYGSIAECSIVEINLLPKMKGEVGVHIY